MIPKIMEATRLLRCPLREKIDDDTIGDVEEKQKTLTVANIQVSDQAARTTPPTRCWPQAGSPPETAERIGTLQWHAGGR